MTRQRNRGLVATGVVALLLGLVLLVTPMGTHHSGNCGSVLVPLHPVLNNDDTLEEQVLADHDCPEERDFRAVAAGLTTAGGVAVALTGLVRRRSATSDGVASGSAAV